jgi:hypothetical protein
MSLLDVLIRQQITPLRETFRKASSPSSPLPPPPVTEVTEVAIPIEKSLTDLVAERTAAPIPAGAILLALRYDGANKPLASVPKCWCCKVSYKLERVQKSSGKTYAFLEPGCRCLDEWMCYRCFVCRAHCQCVSIPNKTAAPKTPQEVFGTLKSEGDTE